MNINPTAANSASGISFPSVKKLFTRVVVRTPAMLITVRPDTTATITAERAEPIASAGTK